MFSSDDTIVAIATPPGRGGIGVVRISGPESESIAARLTTHERFTPRHATFVDVLDEHTRPIDHALVTFFPAPHSYTGEDVVEISAHGSPVLLDTIVRSAIHVGARLAQPGEFTLRAYLHGRLDLVQAEAVADLIAAVTPLQAQVAFDQLEGTLTGRIRAIDGALFDLIARLEASLDFPDEGYHFVTPEAAGAELARIEHDLDALLQEAARGRLIREGCTGVLVGRPNTGKSSLFNRLAGAARAIVTEIPGTTRDLLTERVDIRGIPFTLVDTAGVRGQTEDLIEREGMARAHQAKDVADVLIVVLDGSSALTDDDRALLQQTEGRPRVVVKNKSDLPSLWQDPADAVNVSALEGSGIEALCDSLVAAGGAEPLRDVAAVANMRHVELMRCARGSIMRALDGARSAVPEEFLLADLHEARACFDEITGARTSDDVLAAIFDRFCIGK